MSRNKKLLYIFSFVFLLFLDQFSKYIIREFDGFYICNENLAFGLSPFKIILFLLAIFVVVFIFNFKFFLNFKILTLFKNLKLKIKNFSKLEVLSFILILSGGTSNITDRLFFGCVIDFIDLKIWPVFNLADIFITFGVILILFNYLKSNK